MFIVGIGCVSAQNIDDTSDLSTNDVDDAIPSDSLNDELNTDESNLLSNPTNPPVTSWSELGNKVSGTSGDDTVYIGANLTPTGQIVIRHNVTIIGSDNTYIGGSSSNNAVSYSYIPIYSSASGLSITLKNIKFQNCGGNILMQFSGNGNYNIENCTFENCTATGSHQSIVYLNYGHANITNCTFKKCTTSYGTVSNYNAASVNNVHMIVRGTTFKNNSASIEPGAINNCGQLIVYDSIFEGNSASWWAGAIHTHSNANTTIIRSIFRNNIAGWNGGALYSYSHLTVINSNFTGNEAHNSNGGAIAASNYGSSPYVNIENCNFDNNTATGSGGAISFGGPSLIVNNSRFNNNVASSGSGGAIAFGGSSLIVDNSSFNNNNVTTGNGGAIGCIGISNITNSVFICNVVKGSANNGRGGGVYGSDSGRLTVDKCRFINNTAKDNNSGNALAYYYTGNSNTAAYLTYTNNGFYGPNNGTGSVFVANDKVNVVQYNNTISDYSSNVEPENNTNGTNTGNITIPTGTKILPSSWNEVLSDNLNGTPVIVGNYILVPASHSLYCFNHTNHALVWNFTTEFGYFHELLVEGNTVYAPASWDALYIFNLTNGAFLTNANIYQGSSLYKPVIYNNTIYISSEYGYGNNDNHWISMIKHDSDYYYYGSILELTNVTYGTPAILSQPHIYGNTLYVNTIYGLIAYNLVDGTSHNISGTVGNPIIDANGTICVLSNNGTAISLLNSNLEVITSTTLNGTCNKLITDGNGNVYTVDANGHIYYASYTSSSLTCSKTNVTVNPVTSAMTCYNGTLYIGDNNGILWAFNVTKLNSNIKDSLFWAFNASSAIVGNIVVDDGTVYFGTDDGHFYAI
ncbi:PQQ-binding-like beta-propeller repeat protein [Methanobrevibacter sp. V74]|uniref:PQQ-binding-like beta-propeller repeat protein n=1 Tax=Methanobrevibacter sp. V74 TaxID=3064279 RepID=UPI002733F1EF|nr:PQQ-binding-like beta-propeller repeat protein [Methanobrevibacter sp. V74]